MIPGDAEPDEREVERDARLSASTTSWPRPRAHELGHWMTHVPGCIGGQEEGVADGSPLARSASKSAQGRPKYLPLTNASLPIHDLPIAVLAKSSEGR